jgi:hypothetical protein
MISAPGVPVSDVGREEFPETFLGLSFISGRRGQNREAIATTAGAHFAVALSLDHPVQNLTSRTVTPTCRSSSGVGIVWAAAHFRAVTAWAFR